MNAEISEFKIFESKILPEKMRKEERGLLL